MTTPPKSSVGAMEAARLLFPRLTRGVGRDPVEDHWLRERARVIDEKAVRPAVKRLVEAATRVYEALLELDGIPTTKLAVRSAQLYDVISKYEPKSCIDASKAGGSLMRSGEVEKPQGESLASSSPFRCRWGRPTFSLKPFASGFAHKDDYGETECLGPDCEDRRKGERRKAPMFKWEAQGHPHAKRNVYHTNGRRKPQPEPPKCEDCRWAPSGAVSCLHSEAREPDLGAATTRTQEWMRQPGNPCDRGQLFEAKEEDVASCDNCGKLVPADSLLRCIPYGIEGAFCEACMDENTPSSPPQPSSRLSQERLAEIWDSALIRRILGTSNAADAPSWAAVTTAGMVRDLLTHIAALEAELEEARRILRRTASWCAEKKGREEAFAFLAKESK